MSNTWAEMAVTLGIPGARDVFPDSAAIELFQQIANRHIADRAQFLFTDLCALKKLTSITKVDWSDLPPEQQTMICMHLSIVSLCKIRDAESYKTTRPKQERAERLLKRLITAGVWPDIVAEYQHAMGISMGSLFGMDASAYMDSYSSADKNGNRSDNRS